MSYDTGGFMPIRIRSQDNKRHEAQIADIERIIAVMFTESTACYTGRKTMFRVLCGSI